MSSNEITSTTPTTFLDLPDDVILIVANMCAEDSLSTENVPEFNAVHPRFAAVLGDDFWKQWCRRRGYAIPSHPAWNDVNYRMLAGLINKWAVGPWAWETDACSQQNSAKKKPQWGAILSPQRIADSDITLSWQIEDEILSQSLQTLHDEMLYGRERVDAQYAWACTSDSEIMSVVCRGESKIRGGPYLRTEKERLTLELECCRLVTRPALTGLVITLEIYEPRIPSLDYDVLITNGNGVTLLDVLFAVARWMTEPLTTGQQRFLWEVMQPGSSLNDSAKYRSVSSRYKLPTHSSLTARQAVEDQFLADHTFRIDLGRDLIQGGFYQCSVTATPGSIMFRLV